MKLPDNKGENMDPDRIILCGSNAYDKKYFFNEEFSLLPESVKQELQIMCVIYTEEIGGILTIEYDNYGDLLFEVSSKEEDLLFDEIGSALKVKEMRRKRKDLLEALETFYKVFFLGEDFEE